MDTGQYFLSLTQELHALKDRVRNLTNHWPTDGAWKETVLRTVLKRHLPANIQVGTGFVITRDDSSRQIDVLLYDDSYPVVHKDGDLVFVTRDAVRGVIEVKTNLQAADLAGVLETLANNAEFVNNGRTERAGETSNLFVGLFSYDFRGRISEEQGTRVLAQISGAVRGNQKRMVNHVALGPSLFARYWPTDPYGGPVNGYHKWHCYRLEDKVPGYFINNAVEFTARSSVSANEAIWFPREGKEIHRLADRALVDGERREGLREDWDK